MNITLQETDIQQRGGEEKGGEEACEEDEPPLMKPCEGQGQTLSPDETLLHQRELDQTKIIKNNCNNSPPFPEDEDQAMGGTVYQLYLHQTPDSLQHKMTFPELCKKYSAIAWCGRLNTIACASETCARHPSSNVQPPFWIPIHIVNPERPTEHTVFNVTADSPCDFVQFIEWSPTSCPRALLIANFNGRVNIWSQPTHGAVNLARAVNCWYCEHEWRQDLAVVTKWLSGMSPRHQNGLWYDE